MEDITIKAGTDFVRLRIDRIYGFPDRTSHFGGYDCDGMLEIRCGHFHIWGDLVFSTGQVWQLYQELRKAYGALTGQARFASSEGNLNFTITFTSRGHWVLEGTYREDTPSRNKLKFEMESDQSYLVETLAQLTLCQDKYGDNRGVRGR